MNARIVSRRRMAWLHVESDDWVRSGLIDEGIRERLLSGYSAESGERRGLAALVLLGTFMAGIGVLLLVGYNWQRMPPPGRVALLFASVAAAFGGSAAAYARRHPTAGEMLGLFGVLLFGNAIWLVAQVLHIQSRFSDGFLWWAVGALASSALLGSRWSGTFGAALTLLWIVTAGTLPDRSLPIGLTLWTMALVTAYWLRSPVMLRVTLFAAAAWTLPWPSYQPTVLSVGLTALTGCGLFAVGRWHDEKHALSRAWTSTGLTVLLFGLVPLLVAEVHGLARMAAIGSLEERQVWQLLIPGLLPFALAFTLLRNRTQVADQVVAIAAGVLAIWLALLASGQTVRIPAWGIVTTSVFSVLTLVLSVALIRAALHADRFSFLAHGVLFGLAFILVRWTSLIANMLWSGFILLAAAAGLLLVARLWRQRSRRPLTSGGVA